MLTGNDQLPSFDFFDEIDPDQPISRPENKQTTPDSEPALTNKLLTEKIRNNFPNSKTNITLSDNEDQDSTNQIDPALLSSGIKIQSMDPIEEMRLFGAGVTDIHKKYYQVINRAHFSNQTKMKGEYNFKIVDNFLSYQTIIQQNNQIYKTEPHAYKINVSFGFILRNIEDNELRYFYAHENEPAFDLPFTIMNKNDSSTFAKKVSEIDLTYQISADRPSTKFVIHRLTNIRYSITKLNFTLGAGDSLPDFIKQHPYIQSFTSDSKLYQGANMCFFWCLARYLKNERRYLTRLAESLLRKWLTHKKIKITDFVGVTLKEIPELENVFNISINIYTINKESLFSAVYKSMRKKEHKFFLNLHKNHLSYITQFDKVKKCFKCRVCSRLSKTPHTNTIHENACTGKSKIVYPGKFYKHPETIFEKLAHFGLDVPNENRFFKHFAVFDFEVILEQLKIDENLSTNYTALHHPISVGVCNNFDKNQNVDFFCDYDVDILLEQFIKRLTEIQEGVSKKMRLRFASIFLILEKKLKYYTDLLEIYLLEDELSNPTNENRSTSSAASVCLDESPKSVSCTRSQSGDETNNHITKDSDTTNPLHNNFSQLLKPPSEVCQLMKKQLSKLKDDFAQYCDQLPVLGFNNSRYDLNVIKHKLATHLNLPETQIFLAKKNSAYSCIATNKFRFLDACNYLAPGVSYDTFLLAYGVTSRKSFFCYEFLDSKDKLMYPNLPPYEAFYSELKQANILDIEHDKFKKLSQTLGSAKQAIKAMNLPDEPNTGKQNYKELLEIWSTKKMKCLRDFLQHYNECDVDGFVTAVEKMIDFYFELNVDVLKDCISVPGAARRLMHNNLAPGDYFSLPDQYNKEVSELMRLNSTGGPSIIFNRYQSKNETFVRDGPEICQTIRAWDMNSMYLHAISKPMPTGYMIRRQEKNGFKIEKQQKHLIAFEWLDYQAQVNNIKIEHYLNSGGVEKHIPPFHIDGWSPPTPKNKGICWEFFGCFFHGHPPEVCFLTEKIKNKQWIELQPIKYKKTLDRLVYLRSLNLQTVCIWECEYMALKKNDGDLKMFIANNYANKYFKYKYILSPREILGAVLEGSIFAAVEVDIQVPASLIEKFEEFSPIFCTTSVSMDSVGSHMKDFAATMNISKKNRKLLIGGMKAKKILLASPLLRWYLEMKIEVTRVYQIIEFEKNNACFKNLTEFITKTRRMGDSDPNKKVISDTAKLIGNSLYGGTMLNKEKFTEHIYAGSVHEAQLLANNPRYKKLEELDNDIFEVEMSKKKIIQNSPTHIGFFILQYAKLFLLQFYYEFLDVFWDRCNFSLISTDTDSFYVCFSSENPFKTVKKHLKNRLINEWCDWFPKCYCDKHKADFERCMLADLTWDFMCSNCKSANDFYSREPGLWKVEFSGTKMICLSSKMYCGQKNENPEDVKLSCKGVNKSRVLDPMSLFESVIKTKQTKSAINRGFIARNNTIVTYRQERASFCYFYPKREVCADGRNTKFLDILMTPCHKA